MTKCIGLFGGTFNPLHVGHLNLALELREKKELDEVWFIPSLLSPFRQHESLLSSDHRLKILEIALQDIPFFKICNLELMRPAPSYTIDTIKQIKKLYPKEQFSLLFGEDSLMRFREWKEPLEIVRHVPLHIGSRHHSDLLKRLPTLGLNEEIAAAIRKGLIPTRQMEISSTWVRERLKKRLFCAHLLPGKVLDYISENQLYSMSQS
jgi:nicotinate-nucleotide adenylyltransferase